ncbi:putative phage holin [Mycolicibacterium mageritense]|uniref:putative phage holin n=1 Tax=Mycolicibacterium mageritense TaxID=53462 RepID=UPI001E428C20|nr:hypothetical protein [Mycolicibacterium mageritense]MCC9182549.1 hypothetical protein [Mycolicibacterium mageritense]
MAGIIAILISDIWCEIDYQIAANLSLICIAVLSAAFAVQYAGWSKWWTNRIGKVYLVKSVILALVLAQAAASVWWQTDYPGRHIIRFIIYSLGAVTYAPMLVSLWREQRRGRRKSHD